MLLRLIPQIHSTEKTLASYFSYGGKLDRLVATDRPRKVRMNLASRQHACTIFIRTYERKQMFTYFPHPEVDRPMPRPRAPAIRGTLQNHTNINSHYERECMTTNRETREALSDSISSRVLLFNYSRLLCCVSCGRTDRHRRA